MTAPSSHPTLPAAAVGTTTDQPRPGRTARTLIALLTTLAMLLVTSGLAVFAQAGEQADGPDFLPSGSLAYAELRLDLPGDQHEQLAAFMAHFPGFSDPATFDLKLNEVLDRMLGTGPDGGSLYRKYIRPWFDGRASVGLATFDPATLDGEAPPPLVVALGVADRGELETTLTDLLTSLDSDDAVTETDHGGVTVTTVDAGATPVSFAVTDAYLLISPDAGALGDSLDALSGAALSLADDSAYRDAVVTLPEHRLAQFYVDTARLADIVVPLLLEQMADHPSQVAMLDSMTAALAALPLTITGAARVDADHLSVELQARPGAGTPTFPVRETSLAARMPAASLLYLEIRDLGSTIGSALESLRPQMLEEMGEEGLERAVTLFGSPLEDYLDFVEDAALSVSLGRTGVIVGIVASINDPAKAQTRVAALVGQIRAAVFNEPESGVTISEADVAGVTVTTIDFAGSADLPEELPIPPSVSIAVTDSQLLLGLGDFAADALERTPEDSLAGSDRYMAALEAAGGPENAGHTWIDLAAVVTQLSLVGGRAMGPNYRTDIAPWLAPLDSFIEVANETDGVLSARVILFVE